MGSRRVSERAGRVRISLRITRCLSFRLPTHYPRRIFFASSCFFNFSISPVRLSIRITCRVISVRIIAGSRNGRNRPSHPRSSDPKVCQFVPSLRPFRSQAADDRSLSLGLKIQHHARRHVEVKAILYQDDENTSVVSVIRGSALYHKRYRRPAYPSSIKKLYYMLNRLTIYPMRIKPIRGKGFPYVRVSEMLLSN
jgi:hypothetical protein